MKIFLATCFVTISIFTHDLWARSICTVAGQPGSGSTSITETPIRQSVTLSDGRVVSAIVGYIRTTYCNINGTYFYMSQETTWGALITSGCSSDPRICSISNSNLRAVNNLSQILQINAPVQGQCRSDGLCQVPQAELRRAVNLIAPRLSPPIQLQTLPGARVVPAGAIRFFEG